MTSQMMITHRVLHICKNNYKHPFFSNLEPRTINGAAPVPLNFTSNSYGASEEIPDTPSRHAGESIRPTSNGRPMKVDYLTNNLPSSYRPKYKYKKSTATFVIHNAPDSRFGDQKFEWEYDERVWLPRRGIFIYYFRPLPGFDLEEYGRLELKEDDVGPCIKPRAQCFGIRTFEHVASQTQWVLKRYSLNFDTLEWHYQLQLVVGAARENIIWEAESRLVSRSTWRLYS
ncbi:hypothetical protein TWF102_006355 [Orbilia oligospora]|uniref:Uncharacterized protein n=1 Tax=Orbilia oligospora TaxID=2813651 RepID=A0A7C8NCQ4_ORBOL|nr:hypothetical protein TWF102_006355 [Orbilia oligospora]KAF3108767.1 hypothetical protein TWF103_005368 [Orbilia oligospora]KAF3110304.1 hypothetical protein TWF706_001019 [Orbilia oligospora]KAF3150995.1 hypothetical protein TWF594_008210 [Orbilia oligospora]